MHSPKSSTSIGIKKEASQYQEEKVKKEDQPQAARVPQDPEEAQEVLQDPDDPEEKKEEISGVQSPKPSTSIEIKKEASQDQEEPTLEEVQQDPEDKEDIVVHHDPE